MIKIFKFGGASVKDAAAVRNMADIVRSYAHHSLVVVVSAMGKTTNTIERIHVARFEGRPYKKELDELILFHQQLVDELFESSTTGSTALQAQIISFINTLNRPCASNYDEEYDLLIGFGELISTSIVHAYFQQEGIVSSWFDARESIITDKRYRDARVDWETSAGRIESIEKKLRGKSVCVIQGFIGSTAEGRATSLGREGSDFTAAILAYLLNADDVTIWKDVPGMLNADPKRFKDTVKLDRISFKEAIELAYYGASVIHPKTIKPLQNKGIPLFIKSFVHPQDAGTLICDSTTNDSAIPNYIIKDNQVLLSISTRDFSFIVEDNLKEIFETLSDLGVRIHLMENSAISFSIVFDHDTHKLSSLLKALDFRYSTRFNEDLTLLTILHWNEADSEKLTHGKEIILEQRSRHTLRLLLRG